ncbi:MAG: DoxX family protein [Aestuariivirga sp.]
MSSLVLRLIGYMEMFPYSLLALAGRLVIGMVFWTSGRTKVEGWNIFHVNDKTLFLFQVEYKLPLLPPEIAALLAQMAEHVFPVLLLIGLATRFSALALLGMTLVIEIFVYPGSYLEHAKWAVALLMLIKFGPGKISLDHLIARR